MDNYNGQVWPSKVSTLRSAIPLDRGKFAKPRGGWWCWAYGFFLRYGVPPQASPSFFPRNNLSVGSALIFPSWVMLAEEVIWLLQGRCDVECRRCGQGSIFIPGCRLLGDLALEEDSAARRAIPRLSSTISSPFRLLAGDPVFWPRFWP